MTKEKISQIRLFLTAVMFYTRIPTPRWVGYSEEQLRLSTKYFPAIGWLVGGLVAGSFFLTQLVLPTTVSVVIALIVGVLSTGAFHEDGFADICDGFGGGATKERVLEIMKDSRLGAYGVLGTVLLFALKISTLTALGSHGWLTICIAVLLSAVYSRWLLVTIMFTNHYARNDGTSKVRPITNQLSWNQLLISTIWVLPAIGLIWFDPWWLLVIPVAFIGRLILAAWFRRRIGGYTGDCLGGAQQILELVILLTVLVLIR